MTRNISKLVCQKQLVNYLLSLAHVHWPSQPQAYRPAGPHSESLKSRQVGKKIIYELWLSIKSRTFWFWHTSDVALMHVSVSPCLKITVEITTKLTPKWTPFPTHTPVTPCPSKNIRTWLCARRIQLVLFTVKGKTLDTRQNYVILGYYQIL